MVSAGPAGEAPGPPQAVKWLADENFDNRILRGLRRDLPAFEISRAQDFPQVAGQDDSVLLQFATEGGLVVVTHDVSTMIPAMQEVRRRAARCAPVVLVPHSLPVSAVLADLRLLDQAASDSDWASGVIYLPLR